MPGRVDKDSRRYVQRSTTVDASGTRPVFFHPWSDSTCASASSPASGTSGIVESAHRPGLRVGGPCRPPTGPGVR